MLKYLKKGDLKMRLEKIKSISIKCQRCGATVILPTETADNIDCLKAVQGSFGCSVCHESLSPYMTSIISSVERYNKASSELQSVINSSNVSLNPTVS